jgi:hypothetical protein
MTNKIYAIRVNVPYGEYTHIICAKNRNRAIKMVDLSYEGKITEIKLISILKEEKELFVGGSQE